MTTIMKERTLCSVFNAFLALFFPSLFPFQHNIFTFLSVIWYPPFYKRLFFHKVNALAW